MVDAYIIYAVGKSGDTHFVAPLGAELSSREALAMAERLRACAGPQKIEEMCRNRAIHILQDDWHPVALLVVLLPADGAQCLIGRVELGEPAAEADTRKESDD